MSRLENVHSVKVAYLGPQASYTHQAALNHFGTGDAGAGGRDIELVPHTAFADIFDAVQAETVTFAVVPFENSSNGAVVQLLDLLADREGRYGDVEVCAEYYLRVRHCLLGRRRDDSEEGKFDGITKLYTHPQAWGQCSVFLDRYFKGVERLDVSSTSKGAKIVAEEKEGGGAHGAAIASKLAGELCGLDVLQEGIEDQGDNVTRFFVLRKQGREATAAAAQQQPTAKGGKKWKSLISFTIDHAAPGALADALGIFKSRGFNLTSIDTRPSRVRPWHYIFFVECEESTPGDAGAIDGVVTDLRDVAQSCRHLGRWRDELGQTKIGAGPV